MSGATDVKAGRAYIEIATDDKALKQGLIKMSNDMEQWCANVTKIGAVAIASSVAILAPIVKSISALAGFEGQMAKVAAITGATVEELRSLRDQAKELGKTTFFSASQVADAQKFLGTAGFNAKDIEKGLPDVLNLAVAGDIDLALAADIATNISTPFGIAAENISRVTDLLAKASTSSNTNIAQLGDAFTYVAAGASTTGQSLEEMSASLAILANNGIKGSMAGTAIRQMLIALSDAKTKTDISEMFDIDVTDSTGKLKPLLTIMGELNDATSNLTTSDKMATFFDLFGDRAGGAALVLGKSGEATDIFRDKMVNASGSAKAMADIVGNNLAGDFKSFQSAVEGVQLALGEVFGNMARDVLAFSVNAVRGTADFIAQNAKLVKAVGLGAVALGTFGVASLSIGVGIPLFANITNAVAITTTKLNVLGRVFATIRAQSALDGGLSTLPLLKFAQVDGLVKSLNLANTATTRWAASTLIMNNAQAAGAAKTALYSGAMSVLNVRMALSSGITKATLAVNSLLGSSYKLLSTNTLLASVSSARLGVAQGLVAIKSGLTATANLLLAASYKGLAGATLLASGSVKAFATAIYAIPGWGWALAGIAALTALSAWFAKSAVESAKLANVQASKRESGDSTRGVDEMKMQRLQQLASIEKQSNSEKNESARLVGELTGKYGDFGATIDSVSGSLSLAGDSMQQFMSAMNANAITDLDSEIAEANTNLKKLQDEQKGRMAELEGFKGSAKATASNVKWVFTLGTSDSYQQQIEREMGGLYDKMDEVRNRRDAALKKKRAITGGENANDVAKDEQTRLSERLAGGGVDVARENADKLLKITADLDRERKSQIENEIADVRALSAEYQTLLKAMIRYEESNKENGELLNPELLADYRKKLDEALGVEEERVMRIVAKVEMPKEEDISITNKKVAIADLQQKIQHEKTNGAGGDIVGALESALRKVQFDLEGAELTASGKNLTEASRELKEAITAWQTAMQGGSPEENALASEKFTQAQDRFNRAQGEFDSKGVGGKPTNLDESLLKANLSKALLGGNQQEIESAKYAITQNELKTAFAELTASQGAFTDSIKAFESAKLTGNQEQIMVADMAVRGNSERLDSATGNYESLRNRLKDGLQEASDRVSVSGTFSAQAAQAMGASSVMDRVAKATEKSEKHLEKIATKNAEKEAAKSETVTGEVDLSTELKQQTRYLRDIADRSGITFA